MATCSKGLGLKGRGGSGLRALEGDASTNVDGRDVAPALTPRRGETDGLRLVGDRPWAAARTLPEGRVTIVGTRAGAATAAAGMVDRIMALGLAGPAETAGTGDRARPAGVLRAISGRAGGGGVGFAGGGLTGWLFGLVAGGAMERTGAAEAVAGRTGSIGLALAVAAATNADAADATDGTLGLPVEETTVFAGAAFVGAVVASEMAGLLPLREGTVGLTLAAAGAVLGRVSNVRVTVDAVPATRGVTLLLLMLVGLEGAGGGCETGWDTAAGVALAPVGKAWGRAVVGRTLERDGALPECGLGVRPPAAEAEAVDADPGRDGLGRDAAEAVVVDRKARPGMETGFAPPDAALVAATGAAGTVVSCWSCIGALPMDGTGDALRTLTPSAGETSGGGEGDGEAGKNFGAAVYKGDPDRGARCTADVATGLTGCALGAGRAVDATTPATFGVGFDTTAGALIGSLPVRADDATVVAAAAAM